MKKKKKYTLKLLLIDSICNVKIKKKMKLQNQG